MSTNLFLKTTSKAVPHPAICVPTQKLVSRRLMSVRNVLSTADTNPSEDSNGMSIPNAPGWKETLASTSEAFVKADRSTPTSTGELQARTIQFVRDRYSTEERRSSTTATYTHDEVSGPLKSAPGREDEPDNYQTVKVITGAQTTGETVIPDVKTNP